MRRMMVLALLIGCLGGLAASCGKDDEAGTPAPPVSSLSYQGHEYEQDTDVLVQGYPALVGTRLDDCQTCHTGGTVAYTGGKTADLYPCTFCHLLPHPDATVVSGAPANYEATLNPFGRAYKNAGRNADALRAIAQLDSDEDTFANGAELNAVRYPGDPNSRPGQPLAPSRKLTASQIRALAAYSEFLLLNSKKQQFDTYASYRGVKVEDLLESAGVDLTQATSISFVAPDGFTWDCAVEKIQSAYPRGLYFANLDPGSFTDPDQGFVEYPPTDQIPQGLTHGGEIPIDPWILIAYDRNGGPMDESYLDVTTGRLEGEGPFRLVVPQATPGAPDRGSGFSPSGYQDGYDYDNAKDHNAGFCVRGLVAVRVNPMPEGFEEFDWKNGGWSMIDRGELLIYGTGVTGK
jgi:hypothetical protein